MNNRLVSFSFGYSHAHTWIILSTLIFSNLFSLDYSIYGKALFASLDVHRLWHSTPYTLQTDNKWNFIARYLISQQMEEQQRDLSIILLSCERCDWLTWSDRLVTSGLDRSEYIAKFSAEIGNHLAGFDKANRPLNVVGIWIVSRTSTCQLMLRPHVQRHQTQRELFLRLNAVAICGQRRHARVQQGQIVYFFGESEICDLIIEEIFTFLKN